MKSNLSDRSIKRLREWVLANWVPDIGRVQEVKDDGPQRRLVAKLANKVLRDGRVRVWFNHQEPDPGDGYSFGYPHVHQDDTAVTLVLYLSENPSPLDVFGDDTETIYPNIGDIVVIPNGVWHAVHRTNVPRTAIIATVY